MNGRLREALTRLERHAYEGMFGRQTATDLAICRVLVYGYVFRYLTTDESSWGLFCETLYKPVGIFKWFGIPCFSVGTIAKIGLVFKVSSFAALIGFAFPVSAALTAITGTYIIGIGNHFGKVYHSENAIVATLIFWSVARAADKWSVDSWLRARFKRVPVAEPAPSGEYRWPVRVVWVFVASIYGASGYAKLHDSGLAWAFSNNLERLFIEHRFHHSPPTDWGLALAGYPHVVRLMALFALFTEAGAPLIVLHRYLRAALAPALAGLQFGIYLFMGIGFAPMAPMFLCFVPWGQLGSVLGAWVRGKGPVAAPAPSASG
jgi:hypothetical protein